MINLFDLGSTLILVLLGMQYKNNCVNNFAKAFIRITATMNPIAVACFFEATCYSI